LCLNKDLKDIIHSDFHKFTSKKKKMKSFGNSCIVSFYAFAIIATVRTGVDSSWVISSNQWTSVDNIWSTIIASQLTSAIFTFSSRFGKTLAFWIQKTGVTFF
jgi:hypothetical protein